MITEKGVLALNDQTKKEMSSKHPKPEPIDPEALLTHMDPIFYAPINGELVKKCAQRLGWGLPQEDANGTGYSSCNAIAALSRRLATEYVDPKGLLANRVLLLQSALEYARSV